MISVYDLHKLTPEERRAYELERLVDNRVLLASVENRSPYTAQELHDEWKDYPFFYTLEEIQTEINRREMK